MPVDIFVEIRRITQCGDLVCQLDIAPIYRICGFIHLPGNLNQQLQIFSSTSYLQTWYMS